MNWSNFLKSWGSLDTRSQCLALGFLVLWKLPYRLLATLTLGLLVRGSHAV